ncbi:putative glycosyltransferase [Arthrobacter sp. StoSoilB3]|nr:putative glycosyltransferase [Arthrobacter sp. StoSoilB3]
MKISVITIAWNDLGGLKKTIASVKDQTWPDIEHIIVDGGSTDGSAEYLASLDDSLQWVSEKDDGRYDAMNKGANMATGSLLWFLHSSDTFHSSESASFVASKFDASELQWGYGLSNIVRESTSIGVGGQVPFDHARFLIGGRIIPHQATVFSRKLFWDVGGYDTKFGLTADQLFMMECSMRSLPAVWAEVLCDFDALGAGSTRNAWAHYKDMIRARRVANVRVTRSTEIDSALSVFFAGFTILERLLRRPLRKANPKLSTGEAS